MIRVRIKVITRLLPYFLVLRLITEQDVLARPAKPSPEIPVEIHHATCNIITDKIVASANATFSRYLDNVCNINDIHGKIKKMETNIMREISEIKSMLIGRSDELGTNDINRYRRDPSPASIEIVTEIRTGINEVTEFIPANNLNESESNKRYWMNQQRDPKRPIIRTDPPKLEINSNKLDLNDTVHVENGKFIFTFFWKIENLSEIIENNQDIRTGWFIVVGERLSVRFKTNAKTQFTNVVTLQLINESPQLFAHRYVILTEDLTQYFWSHLINHDNSFCQTHKPSGLSKGCVTNFNVPRSLINFLDVIVVELIIYL